MLLYNLILLPAMVGLLCAFPIGEKRRLLLMLIPQALMTATVIVMAATVVPYTSWVWHFTDTLTFSLSMDTFGGFFAALVCAVWLLSVPYAQAYLENDDRAPRFFAFFFLTESAVLGVALAGDMVTLYLFFELATLFSFPLVLHEQTADAVLSARKYFFYSVCGAFAALLGLFLLYPACGTELAIGGHLTELTGSAALGCFLVILGFGAKAGLYPLHNWLPAAHPVAPSPASAVLSGLITKCGVVAIARFLYLTAGAEALRGTWVQYAAIALCLVTIVMGSFMGCWEKNLKKRLAYSSVSQISYVLLGIFMLTPHGLVGALWQLMAHALAKAGIFQCAGIILHRSGVRQVEDLRGMGQRLPITMVCFTLCSLSLVGIPPWAGFGSKWHLCLAALETLPPFLGYAVPVVLILSALLTAGYLFAPVVSAFFPGEDYVPAPRLSEEPMMMVSPAVLALTVTLPGLFPEWMAALMERIGASLL